MSNDALIVQVALRLKLPPEKQKVKKKVLQQIIDLLLAHKPLPKVVEVQGIFWRNPNRRGPSGNWRFHHGANLEYAPGELDPAYPQGSLRDAVDTLAPFIETGSLSFH